MATKTADAPVRRRGRPKKSESNVTKRGFTGGLQDQVRTGLRSIIGVCETCGHTVKPVGPVAEEIGVSPVVLAKFIRNESGVSMDTFDAMYGYVQEHANEIAATQNEATPENAEQTEAAPA